MNSLLVKAGIPQLRVSGVAGGSSPCRFVYGKTITTARDSGNYQTTLPRVGIIYLWARFNVLAGKRGNA